MTLMLSGAITLECCSTIAPSPVQSHSVAFDGSSQTAGILSTKYPDHSRDVTQFFIDNFNRNLKKYSSSINQKPLVLPAGKNYLHVSAEILEAAGTMNIYKSEGK